MTEFDDILRKSGIDPRDIVNASDTPLGKQIVQLAKETCLKLHTITSTSDEIMKRCDTLTGYMVNESMTFMQLIEFMIAIQKGVMAQGYSAARNSSRVRDAGMEKFR
ncbi:hypothetical protein [Serratia sp. (in: enterobacteria)]|uniref:hypothetical protein n=1 Tax=Serratia sp. (in: enterobacteria) TaxID=616 RepID=UPI003989EA67